MNAKDRAELDRLLDLAEKEQLLAAAPTPDQEREQQEQVLAERLESVAHLERGFAHVRHAREALAPDAEWIDE